MPDKMTKEDSARIQSSQALGGKDTGARSFPSRAQAAADMNENAKNAGQTTGQNTNSGGGVRK
ncbi:hypothetical protein IWX90DRAFT_104791 [Phyllosticta citrichinensis]|uniref:SMP domain-containing protein n=1 Tax=Phyllosticta citrichinensis TaxID=1130410 RepID=A0ABR1Y284_9PEZI